MRILMVSQHYPPHLGGYAAICADTATLLRLRGHEVRVLTSVEECEEAEPDGRSRIGVNDVRRVLRRREVGAYETPRLRDAARFIGDQRVFRRKRRTVCAEAKEFRADAAIVWQFESLGPDLVQGLQRDGVPTALSVGDGIVSFLKTNLAEGRAALWWTMGARAIATVREKFLLEDTAAPWEELLARGAARVSGGGN